MKILTYLQISVLAMLVSCNTSMNTPDSSPNIVIVMADDLGYGDLSCYGSKTINTPNIDALAATGIRFTDYHSNGSVCSPTRASLLTGRYPQRTGVAAVITAKSHRDVGLHLDELTLAEELKDFGYTCGMAGKWHLGYSEKYNPILQGFHEYTGFVSGNIDYHGHIDQEGYLDWWQGREIENEEGYSTDLITEKAVTFIRTTKSKDSRRPFFLYVAHESPHGPYQRRIDRVLREVGTAGTRTVNQDSIPSIYKEMVEVMDEGIGTIIQSLKETEQYENTIFIFLSDNGANRYGSNGNLRGFKGSAYEGGSRVPAIISYPGKIKGGSLSHESIYSMDVLPTLLDLLAIKSNAHKVDGISVKDHLLNQKDLPERDLFFAYKDRKYIRSGDWKLVTRNVKSETTQELYNLANDLGELDDVSAMHPDLANDLQERLKHWEEEVWQGVIEVSR